MASHAEVADHLFMSRQNASELFARGILPSRGRGKADLDECREAYIVHIRAQAAGRAGSGDDELDLASERARLAKEQADREAMLNAARRGELLAREDVDAAVGGAFTRVRARMIGLPSKIAPIVAAMDSPAEIEGVVRKAVYEALRELSETNVSDLIRGDGDMVEASGAAAGFDGEPMGGRETEAER